MEEERPKPLTVDQGTETLPEKPPEEDKSSQIDQETKKSAKVDQGTDALPEEPPETEKSTEVDNGTENASKIEQVTEKSAKVDQGTDPLEEKTPVTNKPPKSDQGTDTCSVQSEDTKKPLRVDQATETEDMGSGASKDGEVVDEDDQYVQPERKKGGDTEPQSGTNTPPRRELQQRPSISRQLTRQGVYSKESSRTDEKNDVLKYIEGLKEPVVSVSATGFSVPEITIMEGQILKFVYEEARPTNNVIQVIHDGEKLRPVIGGFQCDVNKIKGDYNQQFNLEGEYKFALSTVRCTPLTVVVKRRTDLLAEITDDGFNPTKIFIDQGHSIKWQWKQCTAPHSVQEVKYSIERGCFIKGAENAEVVKTVTGSFRQTFMRPGLYFFQTESGEVEKVHHCVVHVRETQREHKVELLDRSFQPMILLIEEGDRVWWHWDKFKCKKLHSVYQIEAPSREHGDDEPYEPVQSGFRSSVPSKQGLLSHEFYTPGVYYYSDQNFQEAAEYIGTVIVKPKQREHYVDLTEKGFTQDVVNVQTGDRIWWTWNAEECLKKDQMFYISEVDKILNPLAKLPSTENEKYQHLDEDAIKLCTSVGLSTTQFTTIGVYNYRVMNGPDSMNTCSVIVNPGSKNHTIHLTDNGFEPKVITVRPNDRVWWVWQSSKKPHDIIQVSHQGKPIDEGFCSGLARDAPSAYVHQFRTPGVFYFISSCLPKVFGAIVVSTQPQVHEVNVAIEIKPDPVTVKANDIVCWIFRGLRSYDVAEVQKIDQLTTEELASKAVTPRRCISHAIEKTGVMHYYSKSFKRQKKESENDDTGSITNQDEELIDDIRVSSVICDERYDNQVCRVDGDGFHPHFLYVTKGHSVLWTWKGNEEAHNIIHVTAPESKEKLSTELNTTHQENGEPLNVISGPKAFNSGKPTADNSFLYTFDEPGSYTVASQGAPGHSCVVFVLAAAGRVSDPFISSQVNGGSVDIGTKVTLDCDSPGSKIFYTIDGAPPELHLDSAKLYSKGIKMKNPGLCFIRFMAVKEGFLNSHIITSRRFFVLPGDKPEDESGSDSDSESVSDGKGKPSPKDKKHWTWWDCVPTIKACFTGPGMLEVFWELPNDENMSLVKGYQLFLNGVSYCEMFPSTNNSINVSGLAGGRLYEIMVEVYSNNAQQAPQMSNKLMMKSPLVSNDGGPIISLERTEKQDALSVVWMSIDSRSYPISGYLVFLNDQQCGSRLVPDPDSNRCKVVIGGCELGVTHKIYVVALPAGEVDDSKVSNLLEVNLPLDASEIVLPPTGKRLDEEELYLEYVEIHEGSGYLAAMDESLNKASKAEVSERIRIQKEVAPSPRSASSHRTDDSKMRKIPETIVEVEQPKYKDVKPLKKKGVVTSESVNRTTSQEEHNTSQSYSKPVVVKTEPDVKSLKSRDSKTQLNNRDYMSQAIAVGKGINKFERPLRDKQNFMSAQQDVEYPFYPVPPQSDKMESSRRQSVVSNRMEASRRQSVVSNRGGNFSRKSSLHPEDAYQEPYGLERAMSPAQMPLSRHFSPASSKRQSVPLIKEPTSRDHVSLKSVGKLVTIGAKASFKMEEQKPFSGISFKTVAMAVKNFLTQQRIIMNGLAPIIYKHKPKMKFDWSKFKHFVQSTKAFETPVSTTGIFQMKAPPVVKANEAINQYREHFQDMEDDYENSDYEEYHVPHPPRGPRGRGRMQRRMSRSQENLPQNSHLSPHYGLDRRRDNLMFTHQPRSFDGPSPERIKRYPIMSGARNIERSRKRTPARYERDHSNPRYNRNRSTSRHGRDTSRSRSFTQQEVDQFLHEQGMPSVYAEYENDDIYYHGNQDNRQYYDEDMAGRDDGYWEEEDESSDGYEPLPPWQQELPHGERYKMLPPEYHAQRGRERHSPGHHSNKFFDSSPEDIGRHSHRSRQNSHRFIDSSPEDGHRQYRGHGDFSSPEDVKRGYYGNQNSPEVYRRGGISNRNDYDQFDRREFLDPKFDADEMHQRSKSKERYSNLDTERSKHKIYDETMSHEVSPRGGKKKKTKFQKTKPDGPITMKQYNKWRDEESDTDDTDKMDTTEVAKGLKMLDTYGSMFRNQLVLDAIAVEDQSSMTDDTRKPEKHKLQTRGGPPKKRLASMSEESESESESSGSETESSESESETDSEDASLPSQGSMVVMDAQRPYEEVRVRRKEREISRGGSRRLKEYVDQDDSIVKSGYSPRPPETPRSSRRGKQRMAIIEVQDEVELNDSKLEGSLHEERRLAVPGDRMGASRRKIIDEGQLVTSDGDGILPAPSIMVESRGRSGLRVNWQLPDSIDPKYKLLLYVVNIVGTKFTKEINNSDISFECNLVEHNKPVRGLQHCWNIQDKNKCDIKGLVAGMTYRVYVIANYTMLHGAQPYEIQTSSSVIYYTTVGPPRPPKLRIVSVDMYQALLEWEPPNFHKDLQIKGFQIYVDNKALGSVRSKDTRQMMINNMVAGKTMSVYVVAVARQSYIESEPSRKIHITCPRRPPAVAITQQPSYKAGCVLISWNRPEGHTYSTNEEDISLYGVYVDGKWYGEIKANKANNRHGYQYYLNDLPPESTYDINVKAIAGYKRVDPDSQHIFCLSDSTMSNTLPVSAPAAPKSPKLMLEGLHPDGIDVSWQVPQQFGDAAISGYQMLKNGKLYGSIIPPDVNSLRIRDVTLGDKIILQLIALTDHPVGKHERRHDLTGDRDSGIDGSGQPEDKTTSSARLDKHKLIMFTQDVISKEWPTVDTNIEELFLGDRYAGCRPGAKLVVHYTGLVLPPSEVWCEQVSGHSALIVWNKGIPIPDLPIEEIDGTNISVPDDEPRSHFIRPENYQVTWWPGDRPEDEINSDSTSDDHLLITNLRPSTSYTVVVEARKMEKYKDVDEEQSKGKHATMNAFIIASKAEPLTIKTARPPDPPSNLGVLTTTCSGIKLAWDQPREHGVEVIAIRIDAVSLNTSEPHHVSVDVLPDAHVANVDGLREKTDYILRVTAITDEYFDRLPEKHKYKKLRALPKDTMISPEDSKWLPNSSIISKTAGTEPPTNIRVAKASTNNMKLTWTPPIVYGSNKLTGQIIRWWDVKASKHVDDDFHIACHKNLLPTEDSVLIQDLIPGIQYKVVIEAVVSVKTSLEKDRNDGGIETNRRTAHVMSKPMFARARAPTEPPRLYVTGYTQTTAQLYWEKPLLVTVTGKDENGNVKYLRRYLEGYKLEINGKTYSCLGPNAQSCALTKCKPGKKYLINLVALTCTEEGKRERKRKYKGVYRSVNPQNIDYSSILDDEDNLDASPSETLEVTLPRNQDGNLNTLGCRYTHTEDRDNRTFGDLELDWEVQGDINLLKQFNVVWFNDDDRVIQTKYVSPDFRHCIIPVTKNKSVYNMTVEPGYFTEALPQRPQSIQLVIPGPPDPPEIFLKSVSPEEFVIEWGEPRLYGGVRVRGYQVYLNDKKAGNELNHSHRKAVIPCKPNRNYRVQLVALSANPEYSDSPKSNALFISTSIHSPRQTEAMDDWTLADDQDIPVKVTQITDSSIHLDWSHFLEIDGISGYKIQWSSVAQPAQREVRLSSQDSSCVINNCLPGTTHFVRLLALDDDGQVKERSKQYTIQTSAPPDSPVLTIRACNFRYIAVQWDKPHTYGDAVITGYKVYVNGIVESILNADQLSFTFTHGKWCQEYAFQVQALTAFEKLHSKVCEPLLVTWPGCKPPSLKRLPTHSSSNMKIGWEDPYLTDGVKVKHFRACCIEEGTEKMVQSIGPIHPDSREAEFKHLKKGSYSVYVEIHLYGTSEITCTESIKLQPSLSPDPPRIMATVVGIEERRQLEKVTCDLVNIRDRLIRKVGHKLKEIGALTNPIRAEKNRDVIEGAHTLSRVEEYLEQCFSVLEHFTGQLEAHVSWSCPQTKPEMIVSGYKVLIDGKQYGSAMHEGIKTVRIKLGVDQPVYRLSMISMTEKPQSTSEDSNVVELLSENFRPFTFYCYHSVHAEGAKWPNQGCCKFSDSLAYERHAAKKLANQGLLKKRVPPPSCSLLDIFDGEYKPFLSTHNKQFATAVLFWTPWCLSSQKFISYYTRFAKEHSSQYNFIAVSCGVNAVAASNRKSLIHKITSSGWREDKSVWHCTSQCASSIDEASNKVWKTTASGSMKQPENRGDFVDLTEILGIAGVPTVLVIHPDGYIAWHGRYRAYDYAGFSAFMQHTFSEVLNVPSPAYGYDAFKNDITLNEEAVESVLGIVKEPSRNYAVHIPSERQASPDTFMDSKYADEKTVEQLFVKRKQQSPRSRRRKLSVNKRPYSASAYVQLLKSPYMQKVVPSPVVLNKMLRPASGGARLG